MLYTPYQKAFKKMLLVMGRHYTFLKNGAKIQNKSQYTNYSSPYLLHRFNHSALIFHLPMHLAPSFVPLSSTDF